MAADKEEKILDIKVRYSDAIEGIAKYRMQLEELKAQEKSYKKELDSGSISREEYNKRMAASKIATSQCSDGIRVLSKEIQNNKIGIAHV